MRAVFRAQNGNTAPKKPTGTVRDIFGTSSFFLACAVGATVLHTGEGPQELASRIVEIFCFTALVVFIGKVLFYSFRCRNGADTPNLLRPFLCLNVLAFAVAACLALPYLRDFSAPHETRSVSTADCTLESSYRFKRKIYLLRIAGAEKPFEISAATDLRYGYRTDLPPYDTLVVEYYPHSRVVCKVTETLRGEMPE